MYVRTYTYSVVAYGENDRPTFLPPASTNERI